MIVRDVPELLEMTLARYREAACDWAVSIEDAEAMRPSVREARANRHREAHGAMRSLGLTLQSIDCMIRSQRDGYSAPPRKLSEILEEYDV